MILCHFALVHMLQGGFFGVVGVLGALAPDTPGIIGWFRFMRADIKIAGDNWWDYMTDAAVAWYQAMHSVYFLLAFTMLEVWLRWMLFNVTLGAGCSVFPEFSAGYATHVFADWFTHRQDLGAIVLVRTGTLVGVNWYEARFYFTEWIGVALCVAVALLGRSNVLINLIMKLFGA